MTAKDVSSEREYHSALRRIYELMRADPAPSTPEGEELTLLVAAVERFEGKRYPMTCCAFASKDCATRLLNILRQLDALFDLNHAVRWFETRQPLLDGQRPVDMITTDAGAAEVEAVVARLLDASHI
jgi:hypothetical protein